MLPWLADPILQVLTPFSSYVIVIMSIACGKAKTIRSPDICPGGAGSVGLC